MFTTEVRNEIETDASRIGVEPAALLAIAEVEAAGRAYATVNGRKEPLIRFEGHYFDRRLPAAKRSAARDAGLADPKSGAVKNPASQAARWAMLARAAAIDHKAAHESVSWGLGQVYPLRRRVRATDGRRRPGFPEGAGAGRGRHRRSADAGDAERDRDGDPAAGHALLALVPGLAAWSLARLMDLAAAIC